MLTPLEAAVISERAYTQFGSSATAARGWVRQARTLRCIAQAHRKDRGTIAYRLAEIDSECPLSCEGQNPILRSQIIRRSPPAAALRALPERSARRCEGISNRFPHVLQVTSSSTRTR